MLFIKFNAREPPLKTEGDFFKNKTLRFHEGSLRSGGAIRTLPTAGWD